MALRLLHLQNKQRYFGLSVEITTKARKTQSFGVGFFAILELKAFIYGAFKGFGGTESFTSYPLPHMK
jgi:hypothetical protein